MERRRIEAGSRVAPVLWLEAEATTDDPELIEGACAYYTWIVYCWEWGVGCSAPHRVWGTEGAVIDWMDSYIRRHRAATKEEE